MSRAVLLFLSALFCFQVSAQKMPEELMEREMRGIWVASVANIDWPSAPGLSEETLRREADAILDRSAAMGLNVIFFQVRPSSDALYRSSLEPWSYYLVGNEFNKNLSFDPLQYWIDGAHSRGMELHAWLNPFRVTPKADFPTGPNHIAHKHPEWLIKYSAKLFLDPGIPSARDYVREVVMDIVNRYDIDGIHFDDYFYPYPSKGEVFDDSKSFNAFNPRQLTLANWRRSNVTAVIASVSEAIRQSKPWIQFGISPFGVWRNKKDDEKGSDTRAGVSDYDVLYADILNWIDNSLIDYVIPQVYWEHGNKWCDFDILQRWWGDRSTDDTKVFIGHAVFKINDGKVPGAGWNSKEEMPEQLRKVRRNDNLDGSVFFSYRQFNRNILGFEDYLSTDFYKDKALQVPLTKGRADKIRISHLERDGTTLSWEVEGDTSQVRFFVVYRTPRSESDQIGTNKTVRYIVDRPCVRLLLNQGKRQRYVYRVAAVDKYRVVHELSRRITVREGVED
ncbi:MAG: family 10 glycosylhydrolase [Bacteroidales bacterium]|nr:family 10 glycosylhydrolase [Bacteroidales bacterium]